MNPEIPYNLEPFEDIVGEYRTGYIRKGRRHIGEEGMLVVTSRRVLYFRKKSIIKKLLTLKEPSYEPGTSMYLQQVVKVSRRGLVNKWLMINGQRHHLVDADVKIVETTINSAIATAKAGIPAQFSLQAAAGQKTSLPQQQVASTAPQPREGAPRTVICSYCGKDNAPDARFCNSCGAKM
nr:zinc-ribbon domain-containing protein [Candidatus Sigynarchaeota archaeon]